MPRPNPEPTPRRWGRRSLTCSVIPQQRVLSERREIDAHTTGSNLAAQKGMSVRHLTAHGAETEQIGAIAAQALSEIHAWTDGDAILLVMRVDSESVSGRIDPPLTAIQRMVSASVHRRTGVTLRTAGTNVDAQRGLVVLAFERLRTRSDQEGAGHVPADPTLGAG